MRDIGKGIAVAGIWIGVGIASFTAGEYIVGVAIAAGVCSFFTVFAWD